MHYSAIQTAELFNVARETIRKWAIEFESYLSATARPPSGGVRRFTLEDIEVFALVSEMKGEGKVYEAIHAALQNGQRGIVPELPTSIVKSNDQSLALQVRITALEAELADLRQKYHETEGQRALLEKMLEKAQERLFRRDW